MCWHLQLHLVALLAQYFLQIPEKAQIWSLLLTKTQAWVNINTLVCSNLLPFLLALQEDQEVLVYPCPPDKKVKSKVGNMNFLLNIIHLFIHLDWELTLCPLLPGKPGKASNPLSPWGKSNRLAFTFTCQRKSAGKLKVIVMSVLHLCSNFSYSATATICTWLPLKNTHQFKQVRHIEVFSCKLNEKENMTIYCNDTM